ncbi:MAG TPA: 23S rRNA (guanosine(2251)-2'-O)-methyltransferase RlmB [Thermoanaerobacterales bacterium]|nr:23S rRNA (guanosine(2251)-2'-O)-methyltransferase RlmB [Thermoanaerobacterales bacterium]
MLKTFQGVIDIQKEQIEGRNAVMEAIIAGRPIYKIYLKKGERHGAIFRIMELAKEKGIPLQEIDADAFYAMVRTSGHQGICAAVSPKEYVEVDDILNHASSLKEDPFIMVLNELTDPQNFGSIIRTADCLGVHGIIISKNRACGITPSVVKVSAGAAEYVKIARVTNIASTLDDLKNKGLWVMGADADGRNCFEVDLAGPIALVIGGEDRGLGRLVREKCDMLICIPMKGHVGSMNAAVAASILGYDIMRQRLSKNVGKS